jgi:hypothetical protein
MANEFGTLNLDEMQGEDQRLKDKGGAGNFLEQFVPMPEVKPGQTGSVTIRILPPIKGAKLYQYNRTHKLNGRSIHCPRPLINGKWDRNAPCPICEYYSSLWKKIDKLEKAGHGAEAKALKDEARLLKPVERYYYNAIVRSMFVDGKEMKNVGPKILSVGTNLHSAIIAAIVGREGDPDSKLGNITDIKAGWDFIIRKEVTAGSENFPKYDKSSFARQQSPLGTAEEIKAWQEALHDLTKLRNPKSVDILEKELAIHRGLIPDETEAFDTDSFDAKWRHSQQEVVNDLMESRTGTTVTVPAGVPSSSSATATEDVHVEDEDFLKELAGMEN